ncbi:MAG TPA: NrfD/PsrC family molybdoenzyme membrane anchor subunit [Candidatus Binatia bacterium]|nr:NrfD/PsrC family molybdoenzyme membrane anchor subunit [Candidatus Binatia bacterium]
MLLKRLFWLAGILGLVPLGLGLYLRLTTGHELANYGSLVPWGLWVAQYIYFIGLSAGAFLLSSLVYVFGVHRFEPIGRLAVFTAIVSLVLALFTIWMDIGHLERFWHVFVYPNFGSPMAWMIWLYTTYFTLLIIEFWLLMRRDLVVARSLPGWRGRLAGLLALRSRDTSDEGLARDMRIVKVLAALGVPLAIMFHGGVGALFGVLASRPYWHSGLYPVIFLVSALASGGALLTLASAIFQEGWRAHRQMIIDLGRVVLGLLVLDGLLQFSELLVGLYGRERGFMASLELALFGPYWWVFWVIQVGVGFVLPVLLLASPLRRDPRWVTAAAAAVVLGFVGVRLNIVIPGLSAEEIAGLARAVDDPRLDPNYFPSAFEWLISAGVGGLGLILFGLGEVFLPLSHHLPVPERARRLDLAAGPTPVSGEPGRPGPGVPVPTAVPTAIPGQAPLPVAVRTNRRRFIATALAVGGAAAGASLAGPVVSLVQRRPLLAPAPPDVDRALGREAGAWLPSCCNACGGQCGILAHVVDGRVVKIEPNPWNPNNYSNVSSDFFANYDPAVGVRDGAAICPKGNAGLFGLYDPDRVRRPRKRTNPRKGIDEDPGWVEISWEQAIDEIAGKLRALRESGHPEELLWWSEDHSFVHVQQDFCRLFGTPNYSNHSNLCDVSRKASFKMVMGDERPLPDLGGAKYILLFGWNPTSALKWIYLARIITRALEQGARLVVVDPHLSDTAAKAQEWVPIRPATDGALALAMGHVIVRDKLYDEAFVRDWTVGFEEYARLVAEATPEWAEAITSVPAKTIERLAREFATTRPAVADVWSGPGQHTNGVQGGRAIALLNALVGSIDRPGGMLIPDKRGEKHVEVEPEAPITAPRFDGLEELPFGHSSGVYGRGFQRLLDGSGPYRPRMGICIYQNLVMSGPGSERIAEALAKLETFVVVDTHESETARLADYLIPGTHYLERYDLNSHWVTWPALGLRQPVVGSPERQTSPYPYRGGIFGQMAEYEFVAALGRRLGLRTKEGEEFFSVGRVSGERVEDLTTWYEEYLSNELLKGAPGISLDELKALPGAVWLGEPGTRYEKFALPLESKLVAEADGRVFDGPADKAGRRQVGVLVGDVLYDRPPAEGGVAVGRRIGSGIYFSDGDRILDGPKLPGRSPKQIGYAFGGRDPRRGFFTPSGKIEFWNASLAEKRDANGRPVDPGPVYRPRDWLPDFEYPLYLINWKEASHTHTRSQNNPLLIALKSSNPIRIHPDTAARFGIEDGDPIVLESPYGSAVGTAEVTRRIHPEVIGGQHGFGHRALGRIARGRGTAFGVLNSMRYDPIAGQASHKEICVRIRRARPDEVAAAVPETADRALAS